jgi:hypothetical protein
MALTNKKIAKATERGLWRWQRTIPAGLQQDQSQLGVAI